MPRAIELVLLNLATPVFEDGVGIEFRLKVFSVRLEILPLSMVFPVLT